MTYGTMREVILAKLDLTEDEANAHGFINRFDYFADEAMTQICSAVKPKHTFQVFNVTEENIGEPMTMAADFISFGDDVNTVSYFENGVSHVDVAHDSDFRYLGYNQVQFFRIGKFVISYNARWIDTFIGLDVNVELNAPRDILDTIPSYVASQCMKVDDEYKSAVYRNEYETFLARIDDTDYKGTKRFKIEGDW